MNLITQHNISIPQRLTNAHKGDHGSVAIIGGADGMLGAVLLASRAALLAGVGRIYASFLSSSAPQIDLNYPEIMMRSPVALTTLPKLDCVAIGPGLGQSDEAHNFLSFWLKQSVLLVLDADALNIIANNQMLSNLLIERKDCAVITPHAGEAARLLKTSSDNIQANRIDSCLALARKYHVVCVLKGEGTLVVYDDQYATNSSGNPGLATAGTGDVLSGVIASLMAQGLNPFEAAKTGVFVHGAAADVLVASGLGPIGLTAGEIAIEVRNRLNALS
jgi:ADP-dependent NAD(P)H-hydrate dehydratase / NAD(P)H-hydrate epimerase